MTKWILPALVALPLYGCSDSVAPTWEEGAEATVRLDDNDIVVDWPDATDDTAVTAYRVKVDGEVGVETKATARNWKASAVSVGQGHDFQVTALDAAGNESAPLVVKWEARDIDGPTWPVGSLLKVEDAVPAAEGETRGENDVRKLKLSWPAASDDSGVEFYRVMVVPSGTEPEMVRPNLVGLVKDGGTTLITEGNASTRFNVYAVDSADNSSKPLVGALNNPTRFNPNQAVKADIRKDEVEETPKVGKKRAEENAAKKAGSE